jgi:Rieske 2Fe-2S family protein
MAVGSASPTVDFRKEDHGLARVSLKMWNGFIFLNLAQDPGLLEPDMGLHHLDNWPMETLVTGHRMVAETSCNWKVFWENYNECLHCPGVHPELSDLVPIYKKGIMGQREEPGWTPGEQRRPALKAGAKTWSGSGKACGPEFPNLTATERVKGANFVTVYPTMYLVAHVDYVRAVRLEPMGPEKTRLTAEWYFPQETLDQPGFDAAGVAAFARVVMAQDMDVTELNQRGFHSPAFSRGRLMPEEYSVHAFHKWVMRHMEPDA